ncbi:MAG: tetratricopeptide repeat protein [Cyanobacteria bacterium J06558_2]
MKQSCLSKLDSRQIEQAIANCEHQLAVNAPSAELYIALGHLHAQEERWQKAIANFRQALQLKPNLAPVHRYLAAVLSNNNQADLAANHLFTAAQLKPDALSPQQHFKFAQTLQQQGKPARAIACYRWAIAAQPDFWQAYRALATLLSQQGKDEPALDVYRQGVRHNPDNADYYFALALALADCKRWVRACNNYQRAAQLAPSAKIYYYWGRALYELKAYEQASSLFQNAAQLAPAPEIYFYWGLSLNYLEQSAEAESRFQQAIALQSDYAPAYYQLGLLWQQQQRWQQAVTAYKRYLALDSQFKFKSALFNLGIVYGHLGQHDLALACYQEALKHIPQGSKLETEIFAAYQQTLDAHPEITPQKHYQYGKLLRSRSRFSEAIAAYCEVIKLDPQFKNAYIDLQYTPVAPQQMPELINCYRQTVKAHPELAIAWGNLGDILTQQNQLSEAIDCYRKSSYQQTIKTYPYLAIIKSGAAFFSDCQSNFAR